jgi:hypothetical protein
MKIDFDDKSYVEIKRSDEPDKVIILIQAKDGENPLKKITNCVEITIAQFKQLISEIK